MTGDEDDYVLEGFAVPAGLAEVHGLLERVGAEHPEIHATDLMLFETAVGEIAANVVEHGRPIGEVRWRLTLAVREDEIEAELLDSGHEFAADFDTAMPDEMAEGGRGLPLAGALLHRIELTRLDDANHWRMVRRLHEPSGE
ncbi:putative anti-sigma regulatory factor, serine/threonine protein kinase [Xylanimonas cellulosilytica DSM 15894]|uniref:Anti-sigma regulatory factor, serine/threonine protein kinase n=1 Tax=Xylanimonas cellulosilytica (strain DSM 15894 / JCM 12276 / CECT 5975 / KCTC 9989 / LMG 20990 / NBRC 107835 / XIL07) TaxID=446471 RepID=D1BXW9_XYLCX|nr:ATP-binding protein [Xylanimonas cellulosilytica]ACZ31760.1 putative anti-sigma regulatory factor, serine/threonine protein kinase [Xylanimonas cellulosilytica DSM 15894]